MTVIMLLGMVTVNPTVASAEIGSSGFLKTSGTVIKDNNGTGSVVNLRGTNLGGWLLQESWMSPLGATDEWTLRETLTNRFGESTAESLINTYQSSWLTTADLDNIKNMGMNFVRVPILYLDLMDKYGNWKSDPWSKLDWLVSECSARGIYVLLDLHGTFGGQNTFDNCGQVNSDPQLWKNTTYQDRTVKLWEGMAAHFKGNPTIAGYDLLNEPDRVGRDQLNTFYNRLYKAIRAIDPDHMIYMEAAWDWNQLYAPSVYGWSNVVYEMHYYAMGSGEASSWNAQNNLINSSIQGIRNHQSSWNVPVYVGEFCVFDFNDLWEKYLSSFNSLNVSWTNWTYKVASNYGNWGYYNNNANAVPNIYSDSASTIASKWQKFTTANFRANTAFQNLVKKYTSVPSTPPPSGTNLALNKPVTFSGQQEGNEAIHAVDGDTSNRWSSQVFPQWITVDLGDVYAISATEVLPYMGRAYQFKVEASTDGSNYTQIVDRTANTTGGSSIANTFTGTNARYVKLTVTGCYNDPTDWTSISEFRVFGEPVTPPPTSDTSLALNKPVTFSGQQEGNEATHAVDGDTSTRWSSQVFPQWINVDLGAVYNVNKTEVVPYMDRAYQFKVEVSADGSNYTQVVDRTANTIGGSSIANTFTGINARYVKLTVTGCYNDPTDWTSISEFKVFGDTSTPPPPSEPGTGYSYLTAMANQSIVCADNYGNDPLIANRTSAGDWESFQIINNSDGTISLLSKVNGKYVCADLNQGAKLVARSSVIDAWEKFQKETQADGTIALKALANNQYVCCDLNLGAVLYANRAAVGGAWETFAVTDVAQ